MPVAATLNSHVKDLGGGLMIRRSLPAASRQSIGPFVFFDHFGPVVRRPEDDFDVRPHPHIGLATVTYLFEGAMMHRDSLGSVQRIEPGAINWMTAGRGIVHSERAPDDLLKVAMPLHGLQLWAALPLEDEDCEPAFVHTPASKIWETRQDGVTVRVLVGEAFSLRSPVAARSTTLYLDAWAPARTTLALPASDLERGVYAVDQALRIDGVQVQPYQLAVLEPGKRAEIEFPTGGRAAIIGGESLDARRHIWWNFVSSSREKIEAAKLAWRGQAMGSIPGETDFIPLPD
jgi:redox-sensitive bicupin YhaK (pirin superfamily)